MKTFTFRKGLTFPEQPKWLKNSHHIADKASNLTSLNVALQERGGRALHILRKVLAFKRKLADLVSLRQRHSVSTTLFKVVSIRSQSDEFRAFTACSHHSASIVVETTS